MAVVAAAGVSAAASLAGGLISAAAAKKKRKQEAKLKSAEIQRQTGKDQSEAIGSIIKNFKSALIR